MFELLCLLRSSYGIPLLAHNADDITILKQYIIYTWVMG
jgi:hypothetical protein